MSRQTQDSLAIVGAIGGGVFLVSFVGLMAVGGWAFSPALFLALAVAAVATGALFWGFHPRPSAPLTHDIPTAYELSHAAARGEIAPPSRPVPHTARPTPDDMSAEGAVRGPAPAAAGVAVPKATDPVPAPAAEPIEPAPAPVEVAPAAPTASETSGSKPPTLDAPDGEADDFKKIKGIGPKLETMLHDMGFYHFRQIANWGPQEVAWVDENLEGFKGRVTRDEWVSQARILADGGETDFSRTQDDD